MNILKKHSHTLPQYDNDFHILYRLIIFMQKEMKFYKNNK